ncbi:hypothetical protein P4E94_11950 [Pontiellaceae bacterium B12219]|nr:hypothetical protein [Pontiellaceae bacterium B12219]
MLNLLSRISSRERIMLAALVVVGSMIWLNSLWRNWESVSVRYRKVKLELEQQTVWLENSDRFAEELDNSLAQLDPNKTYNDAELIALIDSLARKHKVSHDLGAPATVEGELFFQHTLKVSVKNVPLPRLIAFERDLSTRYPYASVEDFSISANKADPRLLNARLTICAYQLTAEEDYSNALFD